MEGKQGIPYHQQTAGIKTTKTTTWGMTVSLLPSSCPQDTYFPCQSYIWCIMLQILNSKVACQWIILQWALGGGVSGGGGCLACSLKDTYVSNAAKSNTGHVTLDTQCCHCLYGNWSFYSKGHHYTVHRFMASRVWLKEQFLYVKTVLMLISCYRLMCLYLKLPHWKLNTSWHPGMW